MPGYGRKYKKRTMRKRTKSTRKYGRKYRKTTLGQKSFKVMRWSSVDPSNCHFSIAGSDVVPLIENTAQFALNNVNGFGELVSLFDNYRILKVLYRWVITRNPDQVTTTANKGIYPRVVWTHDFNDSSIINRNAIYQRSNMKEFYFGDNKQVTPWYTLNPSSLSTMYESATTFAYQPQWRRWMDTNDSSAPHYGIKYSVDNLYLGMGIRMEAKILIECKGIS